MHKAKGPFEVKLAPQKDEPNDPSLGRMTLDKQFHGELEAHSVGQMLYGNSPTVEGSGAYVAVEKVSGTLAGRKGSFILYHASTMTRGKPEQSIRVAPDSGTDDLTGLTGQMTIIIAEGGKHSYLFEYSLPDSK